VGVQWWSRRHLQSAINVSIFFPRSSTTLRRERPTHHVLCPSNTEHADVLALGKRASSPCSPCSAFACARLRVTLGARLPVAALVSHQISWAMGGRMPPAGASSSGWCCRAELPCSSLSKLEKWGVTRLCLESVHSSTVARKTLDTEAWVRVSFTTVYGNGCCLRFALNSWYARAGRLDPRP
jgi:hypothetical protein